MSGLFKPVSLFFVWMVRGYQRLISRYTPPMCRFQPTCSQYAVTSLRYYGPFRGSIMAAWRVLRCNPFNPGGYDPVPLPHHSHPHDHPVDVQDDLHNGQRVDAHVGSDEGGPLG